MRTEFALHEFLASRTAANLSPTTIHWYKDRLLPIAMSCPNLRLRPEPVKGFLASVRGSPETRWRCYQALKTFFWFISQRHGIPNLIEDIAPPRHPRGEGLP
jgi:hypothetical protein